MTLIGLVGNVDSGVILKHQVSGIGMLENQITI
jgi:hypothetical protein